jgi:hypothetical protein
MQNNRHYNKIIIIIIIIIATEALAVPVFKYSLGIVNWRLEEIKQIDSKTRKMLKLYKIHHPKGDMDRNEEWRGLVQVEATYKTEIINIAEYLNSKYKEDQFVNIVKNHESTQPNMNSIIRLETKIIEYLIKLNSKNDAKQDEIQNTKSNLGEVLKKNWKPKQYVGNTHGKK